MVREADAADALAVALVTAMLDRSGADAGSSRQAAHIAAMITNAHLGGEITTEEYIGALGVLAAAAVEDLATATGEPIALWLARWLTGSP